MGTEELLLQSLRFRFRAAKKSGDGVLAQLDETDMRWQANPEVNSIAIIVQHLHGNMLSRWTDFLTADGDKPWRNRDGEFESKQVTKTEILALWEEGWNHIFRALDALTEADLTRKVTIRGQELDVIDACMRNLAHSSQHVGQMIHIAKERLGNRWKTLSIAKGKSREYKPTGKELSCPGRSIEIEKGFSACCLWSGTKGAVQHNSIM